MNKRKFLQKFRHQIRYFINLKGKRFNPYKEYIRKIQKKPCKAAETDNILITLIGGGYEHIFEGLFARKAMLQNKNVYTLRCGGHLEYCDAIHDLGYKEIRCAWCLAQQEEFIKAFGNVDCVYDNYITNADVMEIEKFIVQFFTDQKKKHIFKNVYIDAILYSALQRYYLVADPKVENDKVTRGYLYSITATLIVMDKLCKEINPKFVLSSHGIYATWGAVVEYCKAHNIYVITYGQNYNHCGIEFTYDDSYLTGVLNDKENRWQEKQLTGEQKAIVKRFLDERLGRVEDDAVAFDYNKNNKSHFTQKQLKEMLGIDSSKKIVGLFPNIPWDGQVTGGSAVYPRFRDWLKKTVDYFAAREDVALVIRSHPAEVLQGDAAGRETTTTMLAEMYENLPENIRLLGPEHQINSYTLGENSDFGITYSSTVTLELIYLGIPVILCGCPPFKDKNIAFDISSEEEYMELLEQGLNGELKVDGKRIERLFQYLHYFFFMRTMPQTLVEVHNTIPQKYLFNSEEELDSDPVFDKMFNCINNKEEMDFSTFYILLDEVHQSRRGTH